MPLWKEFLLSLYYGVTLPARMRDHERRVAEGRLPAIVLCWHRIADDRATPWTTSNAMFARQIRWLSRHFEFVSLREAQQQIERPCNDRPCISVTFDDGYADNCKQAIPLLIEEHIPCTYFVTVGNVLDEKPFSHDLAVGHAHTPNTLGQLLAMAEAGIEIGSHSYTHADLGPAADRSVLDREIVAAKGRLQEVLGRPVRYFAFPYGQHANLSAAAFACAREAGYAGVCSAYGGFNFPGDDPFHLQRIVVDDTLIRLKNWVTLDRRKLATPRFEYQDTRCEVVGVPPTIAVMGHFPIPDSASLPPDFSPLTPRP